jgi:hypothetical protein
MKAEKTMMLADQIGKIFDSNTIEPPKIQEGGKECPMGY